MRNDDDLFRLTDVFETFLDLTVYARAKRTNGQWVVTRFTKLLIYLVPFNNMPIGEGEIDLPDYIQWNHSASTLVSSEKGAEIFKDNSGNKVGTEGGGGR